MRTGILRSAQAPQLLAHSRPHQRIHEQAGRALREALQRHERAQPAEIVEPQDHYRLMDGIDLPRQIVVAGIDAAEHAIRHRDVLRDQPLDLFERFDFGVERGHQPQQAETARRHALCPEGLRVLQEIALELIEAELVAQLELLDGFDFLGDQFQAAPFELAHQRAELIAAAARDDDLDDVGYVEKSAAGLGYVIIECDAMAALAQRAYARDHLGIGRDAFQDFHHDAVGRQR